MATLKSDGLTLSRRPSGFPEGLTLTVPPSTDHTMLYTVQTHSLSGSFAHPYGDQSLHHVSSRAAVADILQDWADQHPRVGADERDAHCLVWVGHHADVTDLYPDWELTLGPKMGVHWAQC